MASDYYEKFLSIEGVFLSERQYSWRCGCVPSLDTSESKHKYVWVLYCLYLRNKYYGKLRLHYLDQKTVSVEKKKRERDPEAYVTVESKSKPSSKISSKPFPKPTPEPRFSWLCGRCTRDNHEISFLCSFVLYVLVFLCSLLFCIWYFRVFLCLNESTLVSVDDY
jgi:hypothetical protein